MQALFSKFVPLGNAKKTNHDDDKSDNDNDDMNMHMNAARTIHEILETDILCGKDKTYNLHKGNIRYRQLIEAHGSVYAMATTKQEKAKITRAVLDILEREQCRFLQPAANGETLLTVDGTTATTNTHCSSTTAVSTTAWSVVPRQKARDKTSHALRFYCQQHHRAEMNNTIGSATTTTATSVASAMEAVSAIGNLFTSTTKQKQQPSKGACAAITQSWTGKHSPPPSHTEHNHHHDLMFQRQQQILWQQQYQQQLREEDDDEDQDHDEEQQLPNTLTSTSPPSSTKSLGSNNNSNFFQRDAFDTLRSQDIRDILEEHNYKEEEEEHEEQDQMMELSDTLRSQDLRMILDEVHDTSTPMMEG